MPKPIILLDLDGTAVNLLAKLAELHNEAHGTHYAVWDIQYDPDGECFLHSQEGDRVYLNTYLIQDNIFEGLQLLPGAREAVEELKTLGDLYVLTAPSKNPNSAAEKLRWIQRIIDIPRKKVILAKEKSLIRGDVFFEDWPSNIRGIRYFNPNAFIASIAYPYNENMTEALIADDYKDTARAWMTMMNAFKKWLGGFGAPNNPLR